MEFDERLRHSLAALADSLHQEISGRLEALRTDLSESVRAAREAAVADAVRAARAAADHAVQQARAAAEQALQDARAAADQKASLLIEDAAVHAGIDVRAEIAASLEAASGRLVETIRAIDSAQSLSKIFDVLITAASAEVGRAALFILEGASLKGWRSIGFDLLGGDGSGIEIPISDGGMIAEAAESAHLIRLEPGPLRSAQLPPFAVLPEPALAVAVPLVMSGQVFAVLYVDEGTREPVGRGSWRGTIEVLARHAARALEATARRLAQVVEVVAR